MMMPNRFSVTNLVEFIAEYKTLTSLSLLNVKEELEDQQEKITELLNHS